MVTARQKRQRERYERLMGKKWTGQEEREAQAAHDRRFKNKTKEKPSFYTTNEPEKEPTIYLNNKPKEEPEQKTEKIKEPKKEKEDDTIYLKPEKTGINKVEEKLSKLAEEDSTIGKAIRIAGDWRTTVALVGILTTEIGLGQLTPAALGVTSEAGTTGTAVITRTAYKGTRSLTTQRAFIGKVGTSGVDKIFQKFGPTAARYAVNGKTTALTTSLLSKAGMMTGAAATVATVAGTYPFANFELAEATDKIGIAMFQAANAGDEEEVARLQEYLDEMTNPSVWDKIVTKIPMANVFHNVNKNIKAAQESAASIRRSTQKKLEKAKAKEKEPTFAEERTATNKKEARKREIEMQIWQLRRQKKWDEADDLEKQLIEMLKNGEL